VRPVRFNVAASLDGYLAGPNHEFDWIPDDPTVDFAAIFAGVDTVLLGRKSYEAMRSMGASPWGSETRVFVVSTTLTPSDVPGATLVREGVSEVVEGLRREEGRGEIWLFGGGALFRTLLMAGQVDQVEVTVVPVLLGSGIPLLPPGAPRTMLELLRTQTYPSGMVSLIYRVPSARRAS
jgi:dihydrofolate reductase